MGETTLVRFTIAAQPLHERLDVFGQEGCTMRTTTNDFGGVMNWTARKLPVGNTRYRCTAELRLDIMY
jgi:hypothetical protein